jgi:CheY-like chemotaxis protein
MIGGRDLEPKPRSGTVLLVEDESAVRLLIAATLRKHGYTVHEAANGVEAIELAALHDHAMDLVLTDVVMPHMSGREVAEHLRQSRPDIPVLYMSGYTDDGVLRYGILSDSVAFLQKPFTLPQLLTAVDGALAKRPS